MKLPTKLTKATASFGIGLAAFAVLALPVASVSAQTTSDTSTSVINGIIGSSITITSAGPVDINVTPTDTAVMSSANDTVTVDTNHADGYTLSLEMNGATTTLANGSDTIAAHSAVVGSAYDLAANTWGFRVDGAGDFGAGTTTAESNVETSAHTWAGVPAKGSPVTIKTTSSPAAGDETAVWYAMKADASKPSGTYTTTVLYTAVTN